VHDALLCLGNAELALGDVAAARKHLEQNVDLTLKLEARSSLGWLAIARFALARALAVSGPHGAPPPDVSRAWILAEQARDELLGAVATYPYRQSALDEIERWLAVRSRR